MMVIYGVGVGPGDPELMTLKAARLIREADVLCLPRGPKERSRAYQIAVQAVPEAAGKPCLCLRFPMQEDAAALEAAHRDAERAVLALLDAGRRPAFLTIGDPMIYSTFGYLAGRLKQRGVRVEIASGIPSFCDAAARLGWTLCEGDGDLHILSGQGGMDEMAEKLRLRGTKVILKGGRNMAEIRRLLRAAEMNGRARVAAVTDSGLPGERRVFSADGIPDEAGYMTTILVKDGRDGCDF